MSFHHLMPPRKPTPPQETITNHNTLHTEKLRGNYEGFNLPKLDVPEGTEIRVYVEVDHSEGYSRSCEIEIVTLTFSCTEQVPNPQYDKQKEAYNRAVKKWEKEFKLWEEKKKEYEIEQEKKNKDRAARQRKKDKERRLQKYIELKKEFEGEEAVAK